MKLGSKLVSTERENIPSRSMDDELPSAFERSAHRALTHQMRQQQSRACRSSGGRSSAAIGQLAAEEIPSSRATEKVEGAELK
jgi:hypothetical protein